MYCSWEQAAVCFGARVGVVMLGKLERSPSHFVVSLYILGRAFDLVRDVMEEISGRE